MKQIFIGICAHNEEQDLARTIDSISSAMRATSYPFKILVHDDGSTDSTRAIATEKADYVSFTDDRRGLAEAFRLNLAACLARGADIFVHIDADGQYPADKIPELIKEVENGADLAIGSRFLIKKGYRNSWHKALGNTLFSRGYALFLGTPITDLTSGFRAMTKEFAQAITIRSKFTYTYDQYIQAILGKYKIKEIPIQGSPTRKSRLMKNGWHYMRRAAADIYAYYPEWKKAAASQKYQP
ncbi:MAG TPA: glycosyltransferase family 2 protein [Candidatus Paceibacterota bacterium]